MKKIRGFSILLFLLISLTSIAQNRSQEDTALVNKLLQESKTLFKNDPKKATQLAEQALGISRRINFPKGEALALKNIGIVYYMQAKYIETLDYWNQSLKIFETIKDDVGVANILNNIAAIYLDQGDDEKGLKYALQSLQIAEKTGDKTRIMSALTTVGSIYHNKEDVNKEDTLAIKYLLQALPLAKQLGDQESYAVIAGNIGEIYADKGKPEKAAEYYQEAIAAGNTPFAWNGMGRLNMETGKYEAALANHSKALAIADKTNDQMQKIRSLRGMANVHVKLNNHREALKFYRQAQVIAEAAQANVELSDLYSEMAFTYASISDYKNAFRYKVLYSNIRDTLYQAEIAKNLYKEQFRFDLRKKEGAIQMLTKDKALTELEVKRQRFARNALLVGFILVFIIAFVMYRDYRNKVKTNRVLDKQKAQIETLLLNILPEEVAKELQTSGQATPRYYDSASVLFTDFKGFTTIADKMDPEIVVSELNTCFAAFDDIVGKYGLEKIKTIGDAYMCAGGVPTLDRGHVINIVKASLEMIEVMKQQNAEKIRNNMTPWDIRIGIHVGPVVAGVVGKKKYAYDIWGSTVNIASRMESNGVPNLVNISAATYELIKDEFVCEYRGKISAKNVGDIDMYLVKHSAVKPLLPSKEIAAIAVVDANKPV
jgi:adenylate cyclase